MNTRFVIWGLLLLSIAFLSFTDRVQYVFVPEVNYQQNEEFDMRVHYGFITGGTAHVEVNKQLHWVNGRLCYKMSCDGSGSTAMDLILKIRDRWVSYVDTATKFSQKSYRNIREGRYNLEEQVVFDYTGKEAKVNWQKKDGRKGNEVYPVKKPVLDIVSGMYYMRMIDYDKLNINDIISVDAFLEDTVYQLNIKYKGKERIKTEFGKIQAIKLQPIMPKNDLFDGEGSIRVYLSADKNKIPLKFEADMFVGKVEVDIEKYKNLKYPIKFD